MHKEPLFINTIDYNSFRAETAAGAPTTMPTDIV